MPPPPASRGPSPTGHRPPSRSSRTSRNDCSRMIVGGACHAGCGLHRSPLAGPPRRQLPRTGQRVLPVGRHPPPLRAAKVGIAPPPREFRQKRAPLRPRKPRRIGPRIALHLDQPRLDPHRQQPQPQPPREPPVLGQRLEKPPPPCPAAPRDRPCPLSASRATPWWNSASENPVFSSTITGRSSPGRSATTSAGADLGLHLVARGLEKRLDRRIKAGSPASRASAPASSAPAGGQSAPCPAPGTSRAGGHCPS